MRYKYKGTGNTGSFAWLMQRISGVAIGILGIVIFIQISYGAGTHDIIGWLLFPMLIFATWHTFNGIKKVVDDYVFNKKIRFVLLLLYWCAGIVVVSCGLAFVI